MTEPTSSPHPPHIRPHTDFHFGFIGAALAAATFGGFAIASYLAMAIGFGLPLGAAYPALIQAHGHVQLVGWAGLFVMGVSLHFLPRLASVPLPHPRWPHGILWCLGTGLLLRLLGQPALAWLRGYPGSSGLAGVVVVSGVLEAAGILLYLALLFRTLRGGGDLGMQPAFAAVRPYFSLMIAGWLLYGCVNLLLLLDMMRHGSFVVDQGWDEWAVQGFVTLVLLPAAMAHSVRLFPMVLALATPRWPVRGTAYAYLLGVGLQLVPVPFSLLGGGAGMARAITSLGLILKGGVLLWFVWQLDLLTRWRPVDRPARFLQAGPDRPPTRPGLPDFGEFGRFERLVYAAYTWLVLAAGCEMVNGAATVAGFPPPVTEDPILHMYLLGFITLLIFGVSVRMLPGFLEQKGVAHPVLVEATFWLGNTAAACRVLPPLLPAALFDRVPASASLAQFAFACSGVMGLGAVVFLAANLWHTASASRDSKLPGPRG